MLDNTVCPPIIRNELALHIPFKASTCKWAIEQWPILHKIHYKNGNIKPHHIDIVTLKTLLL